MPMNTRNGFERKSSYAFILIFILMALGVILAGYLNYRSYERQLIATMQEQLSSIAELKVGELAQWRKERLGDGAILFKNATFSNLARRYLETPEDTDAQRQLQAWLGKYITAYGYSWVSLFDTQGIRRMSAHEAGQPVDLSISGNITAILRGGQVVIEDFHRDGFNGHIHLSLMVPIFDSAGDNRPLGVIALTIDPKSYLYSFIRKWPTKSQTAETLLVRRDGNDALFLSELRCHKNAPLNLRIPLIKTEVLAVRAALGETGVFDGVDYRGAPVMAAVRPVPDSPWSLVSRMNTAEVYTPLRERLALTLAIVGVMFLGAGLSMGLIWWQRSARFGDRYKAEKNLLESAEEIADLYNNAPCGYHSLDKDGVIRRINDTELAWLGYTRDEVIGKINWKDLITSESLQIFKKDFPKLIKQGFINDIEIEIIRKDGTTFTGLINATVIYDHNGDFALTRSTIQNITERKKAEDRLRQSENLMAEAQKVARIGHWEWNIKNDTITWSDELFRIFGYEPGAITPSMNALMDTAPPEDRRRMSRFITQSLEGSGRYLMDRIAVKPDGTRRMVHAEGEVERDESGPVRMFAVVQDVTEIKEAEEALRVQQVELQMRNEQLRQTQEELEVASAKYFDLYNLAPVGYFTISGQGLVLEANLTAANLLGVTRNLLVNTPVTRLIVPEDQDLYYLFRKKLFETGKAQTLEVKMTRQDGSLFWALLEATVAKDTQSETPTWHAAISDITERKRAENRVKLFRDVLDMSSDAVFIMDAQTAQPVEFNSMAHERLGYTRVELLALTMPDIVALEPRPLVWKDMVKKVKERGGLILEGKHRRKDGSLILVETALSAAEMDGKEYLVGVSRDITERAKMRELEITAKGLEIANHELEEFAHVASHDLQEPLRTIIAFSDRLKTKSADELSPKALDYLGRIRSAGTRMSSLLKDILSYSLVSGGQLNFERLDLKKVVEEVLEDLREAIETSGADIGVGPLPIVNADASQMRQLLQNLISNAIKYRKPGASPNIKVGGIKTPQWNRGAVWEVVVEDDGIGFDSEYAEKIFKVFERLHGHSEYEGTGVGLATVRKIVQRHGWTVKAEGKPGEGAKFTVMMISPEE